MIIDLRTRQELPRAFDGYVLPRRRLAPWLPPALWGALLLAGLGIWTGFRALEWAIAIWWRTR